jgi:hypothetical protein
VDRCQDCKREMPSNIDKWVNVTGWTKTRRRGVNAVALASPTGAVMCDPCMTKRKRGLEGQTGIFDGLESDV